MKRIILRIGLVILFSTQLLFAQEEQNDPLADSYIISKSGNEIISLILRDRADPEMAPLTILVQRYNEIYNGVKNDTIASVLKYEEYKDDYLFMDWTRQIASDLIAIDVEKDGLSEIIAAWEFRDDNSIQLVALRPDQNTINLPVEESWESVNRFSVTAPIRFEGNGDMTYTDSSPIFLTKGDFTNDGTEEFGLTYWCQNESDPMVCTKIFDITKSLDVTEIASFTDFPLAAMPQGSEYIKKFAVSAGDFNADGRDEIILAAQNKGGENGWSIDGRIYTYGSNNSLNSVNIINADSLFTQTDTTKLLSDININTGQFTSRNSSQAVLSFTQFDEGPVSESFMILITPDQSGSSVSRSDTISVFTKETGKDIAHEVADFTYLTDIDNDQLNELVKGIRYTIPHWPGDVNIMPYLRIFNFEADEQLIEVANLDSLMLGRTWSRYPMQVSVGSMVADTSSFKPTYEMVFSGQQEFGDAATSSGWNELFTELFSLEVNESGIIKEAVRTAETRKRGYMRGQRTINAELDPDIRLGSPKKFSVTDIVQPLVILNAPPIHFDVIEGSVYDVSLSYGDNEGDFKSTYTKEVTQTSEVSSEITKDWGISGTLSAEGGIWGAKVSAHLTTTYGEKFSKVEGSSQTISVGTSVDAVEDDRIYATVMDYNIWEYPVYGNGILQGEILVVEPLVTENRWFPSKSWSGYFYIPDHEVGNIFSYKPYPDLEGNPALDEKIKGDYSNSYVLDENSSYDWWLKTEDFSSTEVSSEKEFSMEVGASVKKWGVKLELEGNYAKGEISTQKTTVSEGLGISIHMDGIDMGLGEVNYRVTPYSYWDKNGALVIDYAVNPELSAPGATPTWWQVHYQNTPDPAFILPWRLDPEKGFALQDEAKRYQTKNITFFPAEPVAGDTVTITAKIHNFSLLDTPGFVSLSFYVGDPEKGGFLIQDIDGETVFESDAIIPSRGSVEYSIDWVLPGGLGTYPRIYAVIDPDNDLNELQESNNTGWAILGKTEVDTGTEGEDVSIPSAFRLEQNYPNPFNPVTTISYELASSAVVRLEVFNIIGQKVATLIDQQMPAGRHKIQFDGSNLSSGIYLYHLSDGSSSEIRKMVLVK